MDDYAAVQIDSCVEEICSKLQVEYDEYRDAVTNTIEEYLGNRLRTLEFQEDDDF